MDLVNGLNVFMEYMLKKEDYLLSYNLFIVEMQAYKERLAPRTNIAEENGRHEHFSPEIKIFLKRNVMKCYQSWEVFDIIFMKR